MSNTGVKVEIRGGGTMLMAWAPCCQLWAPSHYSDAGPMRV